MKRVCLIDGVHGVYIPQLFVMNHEYKLYGVTEEQASILRTGPYGEHYWDVWEEVLRDAKWQYGQGVSYSLEHDNDLYAVRVQP